MQRKDRARAKEAVERRKGPVSRTSTSSDDTTEEPAKDFEEDKRRKSKDGKSQPMEDSEEESHSASVSVRSSSRLERDEAQERINMDAKRDHEAREEKVEEDRLRREEMAKASREREREAGVREANRQAQGDARGAFASHPRPPEEYEEGGTELLEERAYCARRNLEEARIEVEEIDALEDGN